MKAQGPQWPQPDEVGLQALAQSWRTAAADFEATGRYDTSGLNGPWADAVGGQFAARVQKTTARAGETATGMEAVARRTDEFAYEVWRLKSRIVETVNANFWAYDLAANDPTGIAQTGVVNLVASMIDGLVQEAVAHISAYGTAVGGFLDFGREVQGVGQGIVDHVTETVRDTVQGLLDPPSVQELLETAQAVVTDPVGSAMAVVEDVVDPIVDELKAGNEGEAIGRGIATLAEFVTPGGAARRIAGALDAVRDRGAPTPAPDPAPAPAAAPPAPPRPNPGPAPAPNPDAGPPDPSPGVAPPDRAPATAPGGSAPAPVLHAPAASPAGAPGNAPHSPANPPGPGSPDGPDDDAGGGGGPDRPLAPDEPDRTPPPPESRPAQGPAPAPTPDGDPGGGGDGPDRPDPPVARDGTESPDQRKSGVPDGISDGQDGTRESPASDGTRTTSESEALNSKPAPFGGALNPHGNAPVSELGGHGDSPDSRGNMTDQDIREPEPAHARTGGGGSDASDAGSGAKDPALARAGDGESSPGPTVDDSGPAMDPTSRPGAPADPPMHTRIGNERMAHGEPGSGPALVPSQHRGIDVPPPVSPHISTDADPSPARGGRPGGPPVRNERGGLADPRKLNDPRDPNEEDPRRLNDPRNPNQEDRGEPHEPDGSRDEQDAQDRDEPGPRDRTERDTEDQDRDDVRGDPEREGQDEDGARDEEEEGGHRARASDDGEHSSDSDGPTDPPDDDSSGRGGDDRRDIPPEHFGDTDPTRPGTLGDKYRDGVFDPDTGFDPHERDTANARADEGRLITRLPEHPLNHEGYKSLDALERRGPDDPGTGVEYKHVGRDTVGAVDKQLRRGLGKFDPQPDKSFLDGDIVIDGRSGDLSEPNAQRALENRLGDHLCNDNPRLDHLGTVEIDLGDGSKLIYQDGRISRITDSGSEVIRQWDADEGRWTTQDSTGRNGTDGDDSDDGDDPDGGAPIMPVNDPIGPDDADGGAIAEPDGVDDTADGQPDADDPDGAQTDATAAGEESYDRGWQGEGLQLNSSENAAADAFLDRARQAEPQLTSDMSDISAAVDGRMEGLDFRLKTEDSFKRKFATELMENPGRTAAETLSRMRDSVRYTMSFPLGSYSNGVAQATAEMAVRGYENVTWKNTWGSDGYQGINSTWRDSETGHVFELQFHTEDSLAAKMTTHGLYEEQRLPGTSPERAQRLAARQREVFQSVPLPPDAPQLGRPGGQGR